MNVRSVFTVLASIAFISVSITASPTQAQSQPAKAPAAAMEKLNALKGNWHAKTEIMNQDGTWSPHTDVKVKIASHMNGLLFVEEEIERIAMAPGAAGLKIDYTFDQYRNVYRLAVVDDTWGIMDIYEGKLDDGIIEMSNIRAGTSFPIQNGELFFRLQIPVTGDTRVMDIDLSSDKGKTWQPFFKTTYKRIADD